MDCNPTGSSVHGICQARIHVVFLSIPFCVWGGEWVWLLRLNMALGPDSCEEGALWEVNQRGMSEPERMIVMFRWEWKGGYQPGRKLDSKVVQVMNARAWAKWEGYISARGAPKWNVDLCELRRMFWHPDMAAWHEVLEHKLVEESSDDRGSRTQDVRAHLEWGGNLYWSKCSVTKQNSPLYIAQTQCYSTVSI